MPRINPDGSIDFDSVEEMLIFQRATAPIVFPVQEADGVEGVDSAPIPVVIEPSPQSYKTVDPRDSRRMIVQLGEVGYRNAATVMATVAVLMSIPDRAAYLQSTTKLNLATSTGRTKWVLSRSPEQIRQIDAIVSMSTALRSSTKKDRRKISPKAVAAAIWGIWIDSGQEALDLVKETWGRDEKLTKAITELSIKHWPIQDPKAGERHQLRTSEVRDLYAEFYCLILDAIEKPAPKPGPKPGPRKTK